MIIPAGKNNPNVGPGGVQGVPREKVYIDEDGDYAHAFFDADDRGRLVKRNKILLTEIHPPQYIFFI